MRHRFRLGSNDAFSLLELIVVLAGLGVLASLAVPNFIKFLQDAKNDEAIAFLNSTAAECLQIYRSESSAATALSKTPGLLKRTGAPQDFKIAEGDDKCQYVLLSPANESDTILASFSFETRTWNRVPYIYKTGNFAHPDAEAACLRWASYKEQSPGVPAVPKTRACSQGGNVEEIRARIAAEAAERERIRQIEIKFQSWLAGPPPATGNYKADGKDVWAFQGRVITGGKEEFDKVVERECGKELVNALDKAKLDKFDGPFRYTGKSGGCSIDTYLCSGADVKDKDGYDACKEQERQTRCTAAEGRWKDSGANGKFLEPDCEVKWACNSAIYLAEDDYMKSTCGTPPKPACIEKRPPHPGCYDSPDHPICAGWQPCPR